VPSPLLLVALAVGSAFLGTLGGLGGAMFLVPALILAGVDPLLAVPLGAASVVAGSVAAGPAQLRSGLVHHRLGVSIEVVAATGAIVGAVIGDAINERVLTFLLAGIALLAAAMSARASGQYNVADPLHSAEQPGEWPGTLGGSYRLGSDVVPYHARRVPTGLSLMSIAGVVHLHLHGGGHLGGESHRLPAPGTCRPRGHVGHRPRGRRRWHRRYHPRRPSRTRFHPSGGGRAARRRGRPAGGATVTEPGYGPRLVRRRVLVRALVILTAVLSALALLVVVLPEPAEEPVAVATVALLIAAPVLRVGWLGIRWWRLGDRRFALVAAALIGVVALAAVV
jgi:hypothetical protein